MWSVCVQHDGAGLLQVPPAALQELLALGSRPQAQTKQLLHLQQRWRGGDSFRRRVSSAQSWTVCLKMQRPSVASAAFHSKRADLASSGSCLQEPFLRFWFWFWSAVANYTKSFLAHISYKKQSRHHVSKNVDVNKISKIFSFLSNKHTKNW